MPRIFRAQSRTSSIDLATFTPPALPRPPAWICAFTTQTLPPSFFAAATASSTENAGTPLDVGTPNLRKSSLPWYSWMFIVREGRTRATAGVCGANSTGLVVVALARGLHRLRSAIPLRVVLRDRGAGGLERVALVELERLLVGGSQALAGHGLERGRGERACELGDVGAAAHAAQQLLHPLGVAGPDREPDQLAVGRGDLVAVALVGHRVGGGGRVDDGELAVDRDPQPHVVDGLALGPH